MASLLTPPNFYLHTKIIASSQSNTSLSPLKTLCLRRSSRIRAFYNPIDDPVVKEALKEPVAFASGLLAGFLRLDLNEDPLKEWLSRTVQASGLAAEVVDEQGGSLEEDAPQQIDIE